MRNVHWGTLVIGVLIGAYVLPRLPVKLPGM